MGVLLSTYGSRGDAEPMVGLAVQLRALGAQVQACAQPDAEFVQLLAVTGTIHTDAATGAAALLLDSISEKG